MRTVHLVHVTGGACVMQPCDEPPVEEIREGGAAPVRVCAHHWPVVLQRVLAFPAGPQAPRQPLDAA